MPHRNDHDAALARVSALEAENARLRSALDGDGLAPASYRLTQAKQELVALVLEELEKKRAQLLAEIEAIHALFATEEEA